jgi:MFS family permease
MVLLGLGEELWSAFVPKYLEALGAGVFVWSAYASLKDVLDALYQYPGGVLADHLGRRRALLLFSLLAIIGYLIYFFGRHWAVFLVGTLFVAAWSSMSLPATFALIGDNLAARRRAMGFSVQSIVKRLPIVVAPALGGWLLLHWGVVRGFQLALVVTIALALGALLFQQRFYRESPLVRPPGPGGVRATYRAFHPGLKRLLASDILARLAEGLPAALVVIHVTTNLGATIAFYGLLRGLQMLTAIVLYVPAARLAEKWGQAPFISLAFAFFALFPLVFALRPLLPGGNITPFLILAFVVAGLREIGEPARKGLIVDLAGPARRGEVVGVYYLIRGLSVAAAPLLGGWLWTVAPTATFATAALLGLAGMAWYVWQGPKTAPIVAE